MHDQISMAAGSPSHLPSNIDEQAFPLPSVCLACSYAQWLQVPYVVSYHTHIPMYCYKYHKNIGALLELSAWMLVRWPVRAADLTLVMSSAMKVGTLPTSMQAPLTG